jgi:hypothetical protein
MKWTPTIFTVPSGAANPALPIDVLTLLEYPGNVVPVVSIRLGPLEGTENGLQWFSRLYATDSDSQIENGVDGSPVITRFTADGSGKTVEVDIQRFLRHPFLMPYFVVGGTPKTHTSDRTMTFIVSRFA